jgi:hypothetical protein
MTRISTLFGAMMLLLMTGCASIGPQPAMWHRGIVEPKSQKLIAFWVLRGLREHNDKPVTIDKDYGMLIIWDEYLQRFYLFSNPTKTYFVTENFNQFLSELDRLPMNITLDWPDTCQIPRFWKMSDDASKRLFATLQKGNRENTRESEQPHIACYCESDGIKLLGAEPSVPLYGARPRRQ